MENELTIGSLLLRALAVIVLLAANAFFVAAEFALVASRRTRIDAMVRRGDRKAKTVQTALQDLYFQLSAVQLGITLASILLGYVAEETTAVLFREWFQAVPWPVAFVSRAALASVIAVSVISFLHVVVGEVAPKNLALTYPEQTSRWVAGPLLVFSWITRPATNLLNWSANSLVRVLGIKSAAAELERIHSPEEIVMLLKQSQKSGRIAREDVKLIEGVFEFTEKSARDVMTPRTDVVALEEDLTVREAASRVAQAGRSRYPVVRKSLDDITGVVHAKQILAALQDRPQDRVASLMREPLFVPGTREVEDVLADMKRLKSHLAVVLDEYGGTAGIVTMEDLLEEIVGQIYDEYDRAEPAPSASGGAVTLPGSMEIAQANERYKLGLSVDQYQTVGGFVFGTLGRLPHPGDKVPLKTAMLEVVEMDGRRVKQLKLVPTPPRSDSPPPPAA
ncbi:MAG: HlyC/CorC family transporter [Gemmatimonadetes bacterium]|nr:HlyC/CorC family transporter [Gemmatimonadota bacterium]